MQPGTLEGVALRTCLGSIWSPYCIVLVSLVAVANCCPETAKHTGTFVKPLNVIDQQESSWAGLSPPVTDSASSARLASEAGGSRTTDTLQTRQIYPPPLVQSPGPDLLCCKMATCCRDTLHLACRRRLSLSQKGCALVGSDWVRDYTTRLLAACLPAATVPELLLCYGIP